MSKGKDLLNKKFNSNDILGVPIAMNREEDLTKVYLEDTKEKKKENLEDIIIENFNKNNNDITEKEVIEDFIGLQPSDYYKDFEFDELELQDYLESDETLPLKLLTSSENYPENFPSLIELVKLKIFLKDLFVISCGNFFEQFHFNVEPEMFICTTFKSNDFFDFKNKFSDENNIALFYPYVISKCCLFPQIKAENVFDMPAGTVKKLAENILINSKYKSSCNVTKL